MHLINKDNKLFYLVLVLVAIVILFTHPFLRYPYDMFHHLIVIDNLYIQLTNPVHKFVGIWTNDIYNMIPTGEYKNISLARPRYLWHYGWSWFFYLLHIDSTQMILRAKIIHVIQTYISLFSIYYFSKVVIRNLFDSINTLTLKWLSFWSVIIWITVYATFSEGHQLVWLLWYSLNYQITLPLFWYILALTLVLLLEKTSWKIKLFFILQILILSRLILQIHSMEFMYYLMHITILSLVFIDKIYLLLKKYFYLAIPLILSIIYMSKHYQPEKSPIFQYLSLEKLPELYSKIIESGTVLLNGYNRAFASVNELMYTIFYLSILFTLYLLVRKFQEKETNMSTRILWFIFLTSMFALIPLFQFTGGLFGIITHTLVVNRLYYSSSLFLLIPIFTYFILKQYQLRYINLSILLVLVSIAIFSKYNNTLRHNYYNNILSIKDSFNKNKIGFNLSNKQIKIIGNQIKSYEKKNPTNKEIKYYARDDITFVLKYIYKKNVHWLGRGYNPNYVKNYTKSKENTDYVYILFEVPKNFPKYIPYR